MEQETLTNLGLSLEEAQIYLSLLGNGAQSAIELEKSSKVKRTYIYQLATKLIKLFLCRSEKRGKTTVFMPLSPDHLLGIAHNQKDKANAAEQSLEAILTGLKNKYLAIEERPIVTTYEGLAGLKKIYEDTLSEGKEIYALLQTSEVDPILRDWLKNTYTKKRAELAIHAKVILASGSLSKEYQSRNTEANRTVIEVSSQKFPFAHEINIYGDNVAFINYKKGEPLVGVVISHRLMALTMKAWFDLAWLGATKS